MSERPHAIPSIASAVLLLVALGQQPYGYYTFLRWSVCASALLVAWVTWHSRAQWASYLFAGIAILFNPLVPVYMTRENWRPIDVACAVAFCCSLALERSPDSPQPTARESYKE